MRASAIFAYPRERSARGEPDFERSYLRDLERFADAYRRYGLAYRPYETVSNALQRRDSELVFVGTRFLELILALKRAGRGVTVLVQGQRDFAQCLRHGLAHILLWRWRAGLCEAFHEAPGTKNGALDAVLGGLQTLLRRLRARALVLDNDSLFLERALISAARVLAVPSLTVQHGLFMRASPPHILDGRWSDHMLVWGEFFKDMYRAHDILPAERLHVVGYPYTLERPLAEPGARTVCFFGQPWERYDATLLGPKHHLVATVAEECREKRLGLVYRPHPGEDRAVLQAAFPRLRLSPPGESLSRALQRHALFFGMTSTALIEAALRGKVAVQIEDPRFPADRFEALGACRSLPHDSAAIGALLERFVRGEMGAFPVDPRYVTVPASLAQRFGAAFSDFIAAGPTARGDRP